MSCKKWLALVVGLSVLLAPMLGNTNLSLSSPAAQVHDHQAVNDLVTSPDCDSSHSDAHVSGTKLAKSCCFNFTGIFSLTTLLEPPYFSGEQIPFSPSLRLASRADGLYRPPRQLS